MNLREEAYSRAQGHCECRMRWCSHTGRCGQILRGDWEKVRQNAAETFTLGSVVAVCERCLRRARGSPVGLLPGL